MSEPMTDERLEEIEVLASHVRLMLMDLDQVGLSYIDRPLVWRLAAQHVSALVAEVRRLRDKVEDLTEAVAFWEQRAPLTQ